MRPADRVPIFVSAGPQTPHLTRPEAPISNAPAEAATAATAATLTDGDPDRLPAQDCEDRDGVFFDCQDAPDSIPVDHFDISTPRATVSGAQVHCVDAVPESNDGARCPPNVSGAGRPSHDVIELACRGAGGEPAIGGAVLPSARPSCTAPEGPSGVHRHELTPHGPPRRDLEPPGADRDPEPLPAPEAEPETLARVPESLSEAINTPHRPQGIPGRRQRLRHGLFGDIQDGNQAQAASPGSSPTGPAVPALPRSAVPPTADCHGLTLFQCYRSPLCSARPTDHRSHVPVPPQSAVPSTAD